MNIQYLIAPVSYNVSNDIDVIEVNTSSGGITNIYLQKIVPSGVRSTIFISDVSDNASIGKIRVHATGGNLINNASFIDLEVDGIIAEIVIADTNRFIANLSTDDSTPPVPPINDKNFVMQQIVPSAFWVVPHNLNKRCAVQVTDNSFNEVEAKVHWVDDNEVEITFNTAKSGWVYCN